MIHIRLLPSDLRQQVLLHAVFQDALLVARSGVDLGWLAMHADELQERENGNILTATASLSVRRGVTYKRAWTQWSRARALCTCGTCCRVRPDADPSSHRVARGWSRRDRAARAGARVVPHRRAVGASLSARGATGLGIALAARAARGLERRAAHSRSCPPSCGRAYPCPDPGGNPTQHERHG